MGRTRRASWLILALLLALTACGSADPATVPAPIVRETGTFPPPPPTTAEPTTTATEPPPSTTAATEPPSTTATTAAPAPPTTARRRAAAPRPAGSATAGSVGVYRGLGTWVDVYDWSHYKGAVPTVTPDEVDKMADVGVQTLYLQTAKRDTPDPISEPELLMPLIERAHQRGLQVVAWYLPGLDDVQEDLRRLVASANLPVDGIAVDIEIGKVDDDALRSQRVIELSRALHEALPGRTIGAIVFPAVALEVINEKLWPDFPYREIAPFYDVWLTMSYWTNRTSASGYRDAYAYTDENVRRLRNNLGQPDAPVHAIGGLGARTTEADLDGFRQAVLDVGAIGASVYDWQTTKAEQWGTLAQFRS